MKRLNDPKLKKGAQPPLPDKLVREKKTGTKTDNKPVQPKPDKKRDADMQE